MELLGTLVSLVECVSPHVARRWEYHKDFWKNKDALREALDKLNRRKMDIEATLEAMVVTGVTEMGSEVEGWLQRVDEISREVEDIEKEVRGVKFFSRASLGRKIAEKKLQVDGLYEEGVFQEGSLIKRLPHRGDLIPTQDITKRSQTTLQKTIEEIWGCLLEDGITKIGVYGMGGVGKTTAVEHINNRLLEHKDMFEKVIWITVSNNSNVKSLQEKLASKLELDISRIDDEVSRAEKLRQGFARSKRFVLILDDVWQARHDTLKRVGIPDPMPSNGCKLLLTTRFLEVCRQVCCDSEIAMNLLSDEEALELFCEKVGRDVSSNPMLENLVREVARECARLPLAIIVIAGSLRSKTDPNEWEVALTDLKVSTTKISEEIIRNLRLSYDWLKDETLKASLLYCALFPEDYSIDRSLLIDQLIAVGIVEEVNTRKYQVGRGQVLLNELVSVCLLTDSFNDEGTPSVKMHDLIRDMALQIMRESSQRFMVKAGEELKFIPRKEYWNEELEKVTLMANNIVEISSNTEPPSCPKVSTLFLNSNPYLKNIPDNFFFHMKGLNVLNLSGTAIISLPKSISDLVNLAILLLEGCNDLVSVPSFGNLINMKRLDLSNTAIGEVPNGIEMMVKLTHLNLSYTKLQLIPDGILSELTRLQFLSFINRYKVTVREDELSNHIKLETFEASLDLSCYNTFVIRCKKGGTSLTNMRFMVLPDGEEGFCYKLSPDTVAFWGLKLNCENGFRLLLPKNSKTLRMVKCKTNVRSLSQLFCLDDVVNLVEIDMSMCEVIEHVFHYSPSISSLLQKLVELNLSNMPDLRGLLFCMERPVGSFSSLKKLEVIMCPRVKKLYILSDISILPNLEKMRIENCEELEEIISGTSIISLPKLQKLHLERLPELKSISFKGCQSIRNIHVHNCPHLKKLLVWNDASIILPNLEDMDIEDCEELEEIVSEASVISVPQLQGVNLKSLPKLKSISFKVGQSLEFVMVHNCPCLKTLFVLSDPSIFMNLKIMYILSCEELEEIVLEMSGDCLANGPKLEDVTLADLPKLKSFPFKSLPMLQNVGLIALPKLKSIPFKADSLREIFVSGCPMIEKIPLFERDSYPQSLEIVFIENGMWHSKEFDPATYEEGYLKAFITDEIPGEELHKLAEAEYYKKLEKLPSERVREWFIKIV